MKKKLSVLLAVMMLAMCLVPAAALANEATVVLSNDRPVVIGNSTQIEFMVNAPNELTQVSIIATSNGFHFTDTTLGTTVAAGTSQKYTADLSISPYLNAGAHSVNVLMFYTEGGVTKQAAMGPITVVKSTPAADSSTGSSDDNIESSDLSAIILNPLEESKVVSGKPGETVKLKLNLYNRSALMLTSVEVTPKVSTNVEEYPFSITQSGMTRHIGSMGSASSDTVTFTFTVNPKATNGTKAVTFDVAYVENGKYCTYPLTVYFEVTGAQTEKEEDIKDPLVISSKNSDGKTVSTPTGDAGDRVTICLPLKNRSASDLTDVEIYPQLSADVNSFPFVISEVNYDRSISRIKAGGTVDVEYSFRIAEKATSGVKAVRFSVIYRDKDGVTHQTELTGYVNIRKGYVPETNLPYDEDAPVVQPVLMISSYEAPKPLYAGELFTLSVTLKNPSEEHEIKNLKLTFSNAEGVILPAEGGSNTRFISALAPGQEETVTIDLQVASDASSKAHVLTISSEYNNTAGNSFKSSDTISLPIKQQMRVTMDEPVIYVDGASVGMPFYGYVSFYNKGKSQLYNVTLKLKSEGDTMRFEEGYYGGNMQSGSQSTADFSIIPSATGDLFGTFVLCYEDAEGTVYELEKEFSVYIQDYSMGGEANVDPGMMYPESDMMVDGNMGSGESGLPTWAWFAIGGAALLILIIVLVKVKKAKRAKELDAE